MPAEARLTVGIGWEALILAVRYIHDVLGSRLQAVELLDARRDAL